MKAEAEKEAAELLANTELEISTLLANSALTSSQNTAKAELVVSIAEGKIAPWIEKKKEYETKMKQMEVYENLAQNQKLILNGSHDDETNLIVVADSILSDMDGGKFHSERSKLMAEMSIIKSGSSTFSSNSNPATADSSREKRPGRH